LLHELAAKQPCSQSFRTALSTAIMIAVWPMAMNRGASLPVRVCTASSSPYWL
jgi:hypothetical protein